MKSNLFLKGALAVAMLLSASAWSSAKIKVACVGNSITYGSQIVNREENSYPAQLQSYLKDDYEVVNFGRGGRTLLEKGDMPYTATDEFRMSKEFAPDIVLIKLGTNDSKPQNRKYFSEFKTDYKALIDTYRNLDSHPDVILLTPVRCYLSKGHEIDSTFISADVVPAVRQIASENGLEIIELHDLFGDVWDKEIMPDQVHPSAEGAGKMARKIGEYILSRKQ